MKKITFFLIIFFYSTLTATRTHLVNLSFDSLFPMTWYQKGLESSLYVWQSLIDNVNKTTDAASLSCDVLLGRLAFAQFCLNRMQQMNESAIDDDIAYFTMVVRKIDQLFSLIVVTPITEDFIACAQDLIISMEQKLKLSVHPECSTK